MSVSHAVPQGSTLSPFLYIMYVNDHFDKVVDDTSINNMFTDDTILLSKGNIQEEVSSANQLLFDQNNNWSNVNCLNINVSKTSDTEIHKDKPYIINVYNYVYLEVDDDNPMTFELLLKSIIG